MLKVLRLRFWLERIGLLESKQIRTLMLEVSQGPLQDLGKSAGPIYDFLTKHHYRIYSFDGKEVDRRTVANCPLGDFLAKPN